MGDFYLCEWISISCNDWYSIIIFQKSSKSTISNMAAEKFIVLHRSPPPSQVGLTDIKSITERWQRFPPHIPIEMDYFHTAAVPSSSRSYEPFKYYMKLKTLVTDIIETRRHSRFICGSILGFDITGTGSLQRPLLNWTLLHVASQWRKTLSGLNANVL